MLATATKKNAHFSEFDGVPRLSKSRRARFTSTYFVAFKGTRLLSEGQIRVWFYRTPNGEGTVQNGAEKVILEPTARD